MSDEIRITATWESVHYIEIPDGESSEGVNWSDLHQWPFWALDEVNAQTASLVDWDVDQ